MNNYILVDRMIKRICDPVHGVTPAFNRIGQDVDRVIPSAFAIIEKKGCVVHGMTPRNGNRWVAAQHDVGTEVNNQTRNKGGVRVKGSYKTISLHKDAMQVETELIASFVSKNSAPAAIIEVDHVEDIDDTASATSVDAAVDLALGGSSTT